MQTSILEMMEKFGLQCPISPSEQDGVAKQNMEDWNLVPSCLVHAPSTFPPLDFHPVTVPSMLLAVNESFCPHFVFLRVICYLLQRYQRKGSILSFEKARFWCCPPTTEDDTYVADVTYCRQGIVMDLHCTDEKVADGKEEEPALQSVASSLLSDTYDCLRQVKGSCPGLRLRCAYRCPRSTRQDSWVAINQHIFPEQLDRPLTREDLSNASKRVLRAGLCTTCHEHHYSKAPEGLTAWFDDKPSCPFSVSERFFNILSSEYFKLCGKYQFAVRLR